MRLLNLCVIVALVLAAVDVYTIKFEATRQAQRLAKLRLRDPAGERRHRRPARRVGAARPSGAHPGAGRTSSDLEADRCLAVRQARQPAAAAARTRPARRARSDRRSDRQPRTRRPNPDRERAAGEAVVAGQRHAAGAEEVTGMESGAMKRPNSATDAGEPWRVRVVRTLLYGETSIVPSRRGRGSVSRSWCSYRLCGDRRAAGDVRRGAGRSQPAPHLPRRMRSRPRAPISSTATARCWRPMCAAPRCSASRTASSTSTRRPNCSPRWCRTSTRQNCANGSARSAASSGSSARSRRRSASQHPPARAARRSASCRRTSASIRAAPRSRT